MTNQRKASPKKTVARMLEAVEDMATAYLFASNEWKRR